MSDLDRLAALAKTTTVDRLAALGKTPADLTAELCDDSRPDNGSKDEILRRWEREAETPEDARARHLSIVNDAVFFDTDDPDFPGLLGVDRLSTSPPLFQLRGKYATARLTSNQLAEQRYCKVKIADATRQVPRTMKATEWRDVWRHLMAAADDLDVGALATEAGQVADWLSDYITPATTYPTRTAAVEHRAPYVDGNDVCVFATSLHAFIRSDRIGEKRLSAKELAVMMNGAGATAQQVTLTVDGRRTTTNVYRVPPALHGLGTPPVVTGEY